MYDNTHDLILVLVVTGAILLLGNGAIWFWDLLQRKYWRKINRQRHGQAYDRRWHWRE